MTYFKAQGTILALQRKINLWKECILEGKHECFGNLCEYLLSNQLVLQENVKVSYLPASNEFSRINWKVFYHQRR